MTLPPVDEKYLVRRMNGPKFTVGPRCSNPHCGKLAEHAHHIVPSGARGLRWDWIAIDGYVTGNMTGLCVGCHNDVHLARAWIRWIDQEFVWCFPGERDVLGKPTPYPVGALSYQPPTPDSLATDDPRASDTGPESCPFCGQETRRRPALTPRVGRRRRKSWTVLVPDEELENGADVLDSLIDNLAPLVPNGDNTRSGRYYIICAALAFALIDSTDFVEMFQDTRRVRARFGVNGVTPQGEAGVS